MAALACPHDLGALTLTGRVLGCAQGHRFDLARQGYATLVAGALRHTGDPATLVERRLRVHTAGVLDAVHGAVVAAVTETDLPPGTVVDVGAGPGTYLAVVLDALLARSGLAVDASRSAARRAARCHPRAGAVVADVWQALPIRTGAAAAVLVVFAPRNPAEFARILAPGGLLVTVTPEPEHLAELRELFHLLAVPTDKAEREAAALAEWFRPEGTEHVHTMVTLDAALAGDLAAMGPSGHHLDPATAARSDGAMTAAGEPLTVTVAVRVARFRRRGPHGSNAP